MQAMWLATHKLRSTDLGRLQFSYWREEGQLAPAPALKSALSPSPWRVLPGTVYLFLVLPQGPVSEV